MQIKICGITNISDYEFVNYKKVDYCGFIFCRESPRYIEPDHARYLINSVKSGCRKIGVFVNHSAEEVKRIYNFLKLDAVQLSGNESAEYCKSLNLPLWKTIRIKEKKDLEQSEIYKNFPVHIDSYHKAMSGGSGIKFNSELVSQIIGKRNNVILAGGISAENIHEVRELNPSVADINSGVEISPGIKSHKKINQLIKYLREK